MSRAAASAWGREGFLRKNAGRDLAASLGAVWSGAGCLSRRRTRALADRQRRVTQPPVELLPGSSAWPDPRREAEPRLAADERPQAVIADIRGRFAGGSMRPPSVRTTRRWFNQGRWLARPARSHHRGWPAPGVPRPRQPETGTSNAQERGPPLS